MAQNRFWDADDILTSASTVKVQILKSLKGLINIDRQNHDRTARITVKEGLTLEIPYWLARKLEEEELVSVKPPRYYSEKMYHSLKADSTVINLKEKSHFFYKTMKEVMDREEDEEDMDWKKLLNDAMTDRMLRLYVESKEVEFDNFALKNTLDFEESKLYNMMVKCNKEVSQQLEKPNYWQENPKN